MFRIGILGAADIAYNKFMPALSKIEGAVCAGVASHSPNKLERFIKDYAVPGLQDYEEIIGNPDIDCVYIPLPPAFHYEWAKKALLAGKHVFLEKPSTTGVKETTELVRLAQERGLTIQENYMFQYHAQLDVIRSLIASGEIGKVRLYRTSFGFPRRPGNDFRYIKELGGGTMMDNGGYTVKLASILLGNSIRLISSHLDYEESGIDIFGSADFVNDEGIALQAAFGMDCRYQCSLEAWGTTGRLTTERIYTAPAGFVPVVTIENGSGTRQMSLPEDDHFQKSIQNFIMAVNDEGMRQDMADKLIRQSGLVQMIIDGGGK